MADHGREPTFRLDRQRRRRFILRADFVRQRLPILSFEVFETGVVGKARHGRPVKEMNVIVLIYRSLRNQYRGEPSVLTAIGCDEAWLDDGSPQDRGPSVRMRLLFRPHF